MENRQDKFNEIDKLFKELDMDENTIASLRTKLSTMDNNETINLNVQSIKTSTTLNRPDVPDVSHISLNTRYDYFIYCMKNVNYGLENSKEYVQGHMRALNKSLEEASLNPASLNLLEANVDEELDTYTNVSKNSLEAKGYQDGLNYTYKALKQSKSIMANIINEILKRELR